ncbi:MAG: hypothetical protein M3160_08785 [Candidatus Eremiobacteraeota bacterium]|nr:hypothetical protein [Candidatus Eremiobacteraeota bacterium]
MSVTPTLLCPSEREIVSSGTPAAFARVPYEWRKSWSLMPSPILAISLAKRFEKARGHRGSPFIV